MASALVLPDTAASLEAGDGSVVCAVLWRRDDGTADVDRVTVAGAAGLTATQTESALFTAVRARATVLGYTVPAGGVVLLGRAVKG